MNRRFNSSNGRNSSSNTFRGRGQGRRGGYNRDSGSSANSSSYSEGNTHSYPDRNRGGQSQSDGGQSRSYNNSRSADSRSFDRPRYGDRNRSDSSSSYGRPRSTDTGRTSESSGSYGRSYSSDRSSSGSGSSYGRPQQRRFGGGSSGGRPSGRRFGGGGGGRSGGRGGRFNRGSSLDVSKLVKKANLTNNQPVEYVPTHQFSDFNVDQAIKENLKAKNFKNPTPIQDQAIPVILEGKDTVGIANTGTGKTIAFLLPILHKILQNRGEKALIIAPTRELAEQINNEVFSLTRGMRIYSVLCVGGMNIRPQIIKLRSNYNIVVGTPGRLIDLYNRKNLNLKGFKTIVLDEVDRMLDMGFIQDIKMIISELPEERHSLFFSATMTPDVERVMNLFVKEYVKISVKTGETSDNINQDVIRVSGHNEKMEKLQELLRSEEFKKVIIFVKTKFGVEKLDHVLYDNGFKVESLHGNKSQSQRRRALESFKNNKANILVATDVAARGLDVPNVTHVINYDMPATYDDYVHRIGRTGRGGNIGNALTFIG